MKSTTTMRRRALALALGAVVSTLAAGAAHAECGDAKQDLYLAGMDAWGQYCSNCHNAPPASDRSPHEWDTIVMLMRVPANLPAHTADAVLEYMKAR